MRHNSWKIQRRDVWTWTAIQFAWYDMKRSRQTTNESGFLSSATHWIWLKEVNKKANKNDSVASIIIYSNLSQSLGVFGVNFISENFRTLNITSQKFYDIDKFSIINLVQHHHVRTMQWLKTNQVIRMLLHYTESCVKYCSRKEIT